MCLRPAAVSYTHLDVYKRQEQEIVLMENDFQKAIPGQHFRFRLSKMKVRQSGYGISRRTQRILPHELSVCRHYRQI